VQDPTIGSAAMETKIRLIEEKLPTLSMMVARDVGIAKH
jgi:hypothetical protein